mmetsp:Transcript_1304/g.2845  ORF Transcript_1304/g.2845 Transcript_1304/m.2845 type:complete len:204 (-) Transcript_1304:994-1605(-)
MCSSTRTGLVRRLLRLSRVTGTTTCTCVEMLTRERSPMAVAMRGSSMGSCEPVAAAAEASTITRMRSPPPPFSVNSSADSRVSSIHKSVSLQCTRSLSSSLKSDGKAVTAPVLSTRREVHPFSPGTPGARSFTAFAAYRRAPSATPALRSLTALHARVFWVFTAAASAAAHSISSCSMRSLSEPPPSLPSSRPSSPSPLSPLA